MTFKRFIKNFGLLIFIPIAFVIAIFVAAIVGMIEMILTENEDSRGRERLFGNIG